MTALFSRHAGHAIMLASPLLVMAGMLLALHLTRPDRPIRHRGRLWQHAAISSAYVGAAVTHLTITPDHFRESLALGWFFASLCVMQFAYAALIWIQPTPHVLAVGIAANATTVILWTYTRTVNIPFGLGPREPVGAIDMITTGLEIIAITLSLNVLWIDRRSHVHSLSELASPAQR